jgi:hypothetical protein
MKDFSLSEEELEAKLRTLDATRDGFEPVGIFAMCYSPGMMLPDDVVTKTCAGCGKQLVVTCEQIHVGRNALDVYDWIAQEYQALGYDAQILYYCDKCAKAQSLPMLSKKTRVFFNKRANAFFAFRAKGAVEYHLSPLETQYCHDSELKMVLEFLKGAKSYKDLDKAYTFASLFKTADGFKECIERILGLEI